MPSLWSAAADDPESICFGSASLEASISVIALTLLPLPALQAKPRKKNSGEQKRDHRGRDRGPFAELATQNRALIRQRRHQLRGVDRAAAGQHPDQLKVREGEQH